MKIILLLIFGFALQSSPAQAQPKQSTTLQSSNLLLPDKNYIESYWRAETNRRIFGNQFYQLAIMSADDYAKDFVHFNNGQILYSRSTIHLNIQRPEPELSPGQRTLNKVATVLGDVMDTFFMQYSISNKPIY